VADTKQALRDLWRAHLSGAARCVEQRRAHTGARDAAKEEVVANAKQIASHDTVLRERFGDTLYPANQPV
jgi:hypothetical protein